MCEQVSDPSRVLDFFAGVTRWECVGGPRAGLGARYRMLMRVGSAEVGGLIEVVEFDAERDLAWHSVTGIDQRGRWRLRRGEHGVHAGRAADPVRRRGRGHLGLALRAAWRPRSCAGTCKRTLAQLKRAVEHERVRAEAARRRAART